MIQQFRQKKCIHLILLLMTKYFVMCLEGLSTEYNRNSCKYAGLYGNVYDFSIDYSAISNDKIYDIPAFLMRKNGII